MDPRLKAYLEIMQERSNPFYAAQAYRFAARAGDEEAMQLALAYGAANYRPEPKVYMRTGNDDQLHLFEEAA